MGLGGFQETEQLPIFSRITKYQGHVNNPRRMGEIAARCFDRAMLEMGPTQLNIPRDYFYGELETTIARPMRIRHGPGDAAALDAAADMLAAARFPVIVAGGGVIMAEATAERQDELVSEMADRRIGYSAPFSWKALADALAHAVKSGKTD